jgi:hypothetical protein
VCRMIHAVKRQDGGKQVRIYEEEDTCVCVCVQDGGKQVRGKQVRSISCVCVCVCVCVCAIRCQLQKRPTKSVKRDLLKVSKETY